MIFLFIVFLLSFSTFFTTPSMNWWAIWDLVLKIYHFIWNWVQENLFANLSRNIFYLIFFFHSTQIFLYINFTFFDRDPLNLRCLHMPDTIPNNDLPACLEFFLLKTLKSERVEWERKRENERIEEMIKWHAWTWRNKKEMERWRKRRSQ